ncbi:Metallo-dependent phosphatase-like protein [Cladorrhinum sp. PSN332]|nr:Metallo-dependent phosphatase-like protein [Cladorrhinum sp. PSN332]
MDEVLAQPLTFESSALRFVCISDTHNDDCRRHIPAGDILLHAGDMTNFGTVDEMRAAVDWIASLPHPLKIIVAGNHDMGLDTAHSTYSPESQSAPHPGFLGKPYAFIYPPAPSAQATAAWESASALAGLDQTNEVQIWLMHSPPFGRLDRVPVPGLTGCRVQMDKIAAARPQLCLFGHYHYPWGVERVKWREEGGADSGSEDKNIADVRLLTASPERQAAEGFTIPVKSEFDFSGDGEEERLVRGKETLFVNAGWMTMKKNATDYRNPPFVITLSLE